MTKPLYRPIVLLAGLALIGAAAIFWSWRSVNGTSAVPFQLPWLMSGGAIGLGIIGMALASWSVHLERREDMETRRQMGEVMGLVAQMKSRGRR